MAVVLPPDLFKPTASLHEPAVLIGLRPAIAAGRSDASKPASLIVFVQFDAQPLVDAGNRPVGEIMDDALRAGFAVDDADDPAEIVFEFVSIAARQPGSTFG